MRKKRYLDLMDQMERVELLCHQIIGQTAALNERLDRMEKRMDTLENAPADGTTNGSSMWAEGIDNVLGYQWPPKRGDGQ